MEIDVELALLDAMAEQMEVLEAFLPKTFELEDRTVKGWGLVISPANEISGNFEQAIDAFLDVLEPAWESFESFDALLRVGIFHSTLTCTFEITNCERLAKLGLKLQVSTYPCSDD